MGELIFGRCQTIFNLKRLNVISIRTTEALNPPETRTLLKNRLTTLLFATFLLFKNLFAKALPIYVTLRMINCNFLGKYTEGKNAKLPFVILLRKNFGICGISYRTTQRCSHINFKLLTIKESSFFRIS